MLRKFVSDESGMEMVEYAVFAALLVAAGIIGATALWTNIQTKFSAVATWILSPQ